ncbi:MAG: hypothetical protein Q9195_005555 [Heterodermia aff. obscurata]
MANNFGEYGSEFDPTGPFDIDDLNFSDEQQSPYLFQPQPTSFPRQWLSSFQELESHDLGKTVNNDDLPSDFLDPQTLILDSSQAYEPARTPEIAPQFSGELLPSEYHKMRADWHCNAEKFHRNQAQELVELAQIGDYQEPHPKQPLPVIDLSNEHSPEAVHAIPKNHDSESEQEDAKRRKKKGYQHHPSRISSGGAVQKLVEPTSALPADLSVALMADSNLQKHANITDASKIHPRILSRVMFKPENVYSPLHTRPIPWGDHTLDGQTTSGRFKYNEFGELQPGDFFTKEEMRTYLFDHYLHYSGGDYNPKEGGLKLWIQRNPADSKNRYGHPCAARCRFLDCVAQHRLIGQGQNRICFDELSCRGENLDPMHNAGYVHLYCLERFMDFPRICSTLQVHVEDRHMPDEQNGNNKMTLSSSKETREASRFIDNCERGLLSRSYPHYQTPNRPYEGTLNHRICVKKVAAEPSRIKKARIERGSRLSTLDHHLGDLEMETEHRVQSRLAKNQNRNYQGQSPDVDGEDHSLAAVTSSAPIPQRQFMEMEMRSPSSPQALSWHPEPITNQDSSAYVPPNGQGTTSQNFGFAADWTESSSESTLLSNDGEDIYDGYYIDLQRI